MEATCPKCQAVNHVGDELVGRYTFCDKCLCRFYVEAPTLEALHRPKATGAPLRAAPTAATSLDDLLRDTQQGSRYVIQILEQQYRMLQRMQWALWMIGALAVANLLGVFWNQQADHPTAHHEPESIRIPGQR